MLERVPVYDLRVPELDVVSEIEAAECTVRDVYAVVLPQKDHPFADLIDTPGLLARLGEEEALN